MENKILDGMTREQALGCIVCYHASEDVCVLVINGKYYNTPCEAGLPAVSRYGETWRDTWTRAINAEFDKREAEAKKPKWVEPECESVGVGTACYLEKFYSGSIYGKNNEIARTNARRKIEAFRDANCKSGEWYIEYDHDSYKFVVIFHGRNSLGAISFSDPKCAEECIRRFHEELNLLAGVHS